jgi:hypothetical protein
MPLKIFYSSSSSRLFPAANPRSAEFNLGARFPTDENMDVRFVKTEDFSLVRNATFTNKL